MDASGVLSKGCSRGCLRPAGTYVWSAMALPVALCRGMRRAHSQRQFHPER